MRNLTHGLRLIAAIGFVTGMFSGLTPAAESGSTQMQTAKQFKFSRTVTAQLNYLLFLPKGYEAKAEKRWPLMLFLHGAGERGSDVWKVATHGPPKLVAQRSDF